MKNIKCIETNCPMFSESDIFKTCRVKPAQYIVSECRPDAIRLRMEEIACKIAKLTTEYNTLVVLESYIKDHQD